MVVCSSFSSDLSLERWKWSWQPCIWKLMHFSTFRANMYLIMTFCTRSHTHNHRVGKAIRLSELPASQCRAGDQNDLIWIHFWTGRRTHVRPASGPRLARVRPASGPQSAVGSRPELPASQCRPGDQNDLIGIHFWTGRRTHVRAASGPRPGRGTAGKPVSARFTTNDSYQIFSDPVSRSVLLSEHPTAGPRAGVVPDLLCCWGCRCHTYNWVAH